MPFASAPHDIIFQLLYASQDLKSLLSLGSVSKPYYAVLRRHRLSLLQRLLSTSIDREIVPLALHVAREDLSESLAEEHRSSIAAEASSGKEAENPSPSGSERGSTLSEVVTVQRAIQNHPALLNLANTVRALHSLSKAVNIAQGWGYECHNCEPTTWSGRDLPTTLSSKDWLHATYRFAAEGLKVYKVSHIPKNGPGAAGIDFNKVAVAQPVVDRVAWVCLRFRDRNPFMTGPDGEIHFDELDEHDELGRKMERQVIHTVVTGRPLVWKRAAELMGAWPSQNARLGIDLEAWGTEIEARIKKGRCVVKNDREILAKMEDESWRVFEDCLERGIVEDVYRPRREYLAEIEYSLADVVEDGIRRRRDGRLRRAAQGQD